MSEQIWDSAKGAGSLLEVHLSNTDFPASFFSRRYTPTTLTLIQGGFSAPKVIEVLLHTSYLTSSSSALTNRRLFETTQMILDAMTDLTPSSGIGFRSVLGVRMLHSHVRIRLLNSTTYDTKHFG